MTRPLEPRGVGLPAGTGTPLLVVGAIWGAVGLGGLVWLAGGAASWLTGSGWQVPPFDTTSAGRFVRGGPAVLWPATPAWLVWTLSAVKLALVTAVVAVVVARRDGRARSGLAGLAQVQHLLPRAVTERARSLRLGLPRSGEVAPEDTGLALGRLGARGPELRASWEDVLLAVMAPRAGKTTSLAVPAVLAAPGAVVATSNKADLWAATATLRAVDTGEPVWVFDPQAITGAPRTWWWDPLRGLSTVEEASRLAGHFIQEVRDDRTGKDFWTSAAHDLLAGLLLAAACSGRDLRDVYEWLNDPVIPTPAALLAEAGFTASAASLRGRQNGAPETRDGVYETARTAAQCLRDDVILAWVTPPGADLAEFDAAGFATTRQTLYLLSKDGAGAAAPLVAALTDRVMREGVRAAERRGGRLDPPMVIVLDEAANVCRIADLPDLYSHLGSRGVVPLTVLQSYRQGARVWGEAGMDTLWSAATVKLLGAGLDDAKLAEDVSRLVGEHDVTVRSYSDGERRRSTSTSLRRQRILPPEDLRALPRGTALLLATGTRAALLQLQPYYHGPRRDEIAAAVSAATRQVQEARGSAEGVSVR
ncbi:type IV secretory system conjugative DNA transfer family protein [Kineococcus glutinatus]|uniref:TraD/TraG TraM recognition site domain-containing protein n=1 Tax=Kineococcus glutinatus TaxID=1070872 RepID=A0ABP9HDZ9_9ACTN